MTVADVKVGDWASFWKDCGSLVRVIHVEPRGSWGVRVTWDHGPKTKRTTRVMPAGNATQVHRG